MSHTDHPLTLRVATERDAVALLRLAQLDCSSVPAAPVLLAERGGELLAARSLTTGHTVADPFVPTRDVVGLLAARGAQLAPVRRSAPVRHLRGLAVPRPAG